MKTTIKSIAILAAVVVSLGLLHSCEKEPSVIKIFVRSASNELMEGAKVIIIGDVNSNPVTLAHVDTVVTNGSGFAYFNMESHYEGGDKDYTVGYFDIIAKTETKTGFGYIRSRVHTTAVETVYLPN